MVATRLSNVASKGLSWYNGPSASSGNSTSDGAAPNTTPSTNSSNSNSTAPPPATPKRSGSSPPEEESSPISSPSKYWDYAQDAAEHTYSALSEYIPSMSWTSSTGGIADAGGASSSSSMEPMFMENMPVSNTARPKTSSLLMSPSLLNMFHNPYVVVRGGGNHQVNRPTSSMAAIRSFINAVPPRHDSSDEGADGGASEGSSSMVQNGGDSSLGGGENTYDSTTRNNGMAPTNLSERYQPYSVGRQSSPSETASQLAEGTLRAFRDIALDEAVELHEALRYWSYRWERPLLSWLEAGPTVWFSEEGYQHQQVGQKVSQIQAVLARRCVTIGDLQSHLLRAGWQRGVAQWGVLGEGGEWATVAGGDGRMVTESTTPTYGSSHSSTGNHRPPQHSIPPPPPPPPGYSMRRVTSDMMDNLPPPPNSSRTQLPRKAPSSNVSELQQSRHNELYYTSVFVKNYDGGQIMIDDPALAEWSVDAMSLVRRQLYRAANGKITLPYTENWAEGDDQSRLSYDVAGSLVLDGSTAVTDETVAGAKLPLWASLRLKQEDEMEDDGEDRFVHDADKEDGTTETATRVQISDLPLLVNEVSELLDIMESVMHMQRARRLEKLKPMRWWIRNWYVGALAFPPLLYVGWRASKNGYGMDFLKYAAKIIGDFCQEHVVDPFLAMYNEFTKGNQDISDREARNVAIKNLQKMIRSWLDETHPDMPVKERKRMAKAMDISLIEAEKEESMKTIYNINSVIRMSFIEAQFLKKEMMNALLAMDEMRASTNFNMNLAAVTPFVLFVWATQRLFKFVYYAMLKIGKSREETYGSFFHTLTEMERLLVMRDNPPAPLSHRPTAHDSASHAFLGDSLLNADDLGMLMLHIHELRTVLWQDRRRFSHNVMRSVAEDLSELAGERGAVSVRQQLQIIGRMCRTYPFLRAVNNRMFEYR